MGDVGAQWTGVFLNESVLSGVLPLKRWGAIKAALSNWPCVIKPSLAYQPICSHQPYLIFSSENLSGICFFFYNVNNLLLCFVSFLWFYFAAGCYYEQTKDSSPPPTVPVVWFLHK